MPGEAPVDGKSRKKLEEAAGTENADWKELTSDNPEIGSPRSEISGGKACIDDGRGEGGGAVENLIGESETSEFDAKSMRKSKPGLKRLFLSASVFFSFFLGLPFFLKSVEIYRSHLPFHKIDELSRVIETRPILFPCNFRAVFVGFEPNDQNHAQKLSLSIYGRMRQLADGDGRCGTCGSNYSVSVMLQLNDNCVRNQEVDAPGFWHCGSVQKSDFDASLKADELVDELLDSMLSGGNKCGCDCDIAYTMVVVNGDEKVRTVVGKHRHGWIVGKISLEAAAKKVAEVFVNVFENGGRNERSIHGEFMPVGADGSIVLSFNLLNADPNDWIYEWDFKRAEEILFAPVVEALAPIVNISLESQILYHTPKSFFSHWDDEKGSYIFSTRDLPFFVNSNEWHLDTSVAAGGRSKVLHIVIYVPSAKECPLLLQLPDGEVSKTNSFISPMWGGVIIWNPSECSRTSDIEHSLRRKIPFPDLVEVFEVFMGQLRQLFGLGSKSVYVGMPGSVNFLPSERGFTKWELDVLSRQHTCFNLQSCATTLGSLSRLVQSLPRMIIIDEIGKQVKFSLQEANLAQGNASLGIYDASAASSRQARSLAEDAFLHPSIMSVSYYSFEHCFAVYSPFFLPVLLHVVIAAIKERRRYKQEMSKYLAWKAKENCCRDPRHSQSC
ncbi:GPI transamidase component PIG-S-like protein [Drosera capensis]